MFRLLPRGAVALALVMLAVLGTGASAQTLADYPLVDHPAGVHVVTMGPDGAQCDQAEEAELADQLSARRAGVRLTTVRSTNPAGSTRFRILLRATDQLLADPLALLAFRRAAARWERIIQSDITTVIDVDYGRTRFGETEERPNVLGSASSAIRRTSLTVGAFVDLLKGQTADAQLIALYDAIPVPTPSTLRDGFGAPVNLSTALIGTIPLQAYGLLPAELNPDPAANPFRQVPNIWFNSAFSFDFDPRDGVNPTQTDFEGVVTHEIGHTLGFVSIIGSPEAPQFLPWDLFRVRPDAVTANENLGDGQGWEVAERVVTPGPVETEVIATVEGVQFFSAVQVFFDGRQLYETSTGDPRGENGDGSQASHWRDDRRRSPEFGPQRKIGIMDPNLGRGERDTISDADIRFLEVLGFAVDYDPPTAEARYALNGRELDTETTVLFERDFLLGTDPGEGSTATLTVRNADPSTDLAYEVEFVRDRVAGGDAPPVSVSVTLANAAGTVAPGASAQVDVAFSASSPALVYGHLLLRSNDPSQYVVRLPVVFSVGGAAFPSLQASALSLEAVAETQRLLAVEARNPSGLGGLEYVRILEPALSTGAPGLAEPPAPARVADPVSAALDVSAGPVAAASRAAGGAAPAVRASVALPGATFPFAITELGDGRLLVSDVDLASNATARTRGLYLVEADLSAVTRLPAPDASDYLTGLAYDDRTGNVWIAEFFSGRLREAFFSGAELLFTGTEIALGFAPVSLSYSAELDALVVTPNRTDEVYAFHRTGRPVVGYPVRLPQAQASSITSQSFREGVLEINGAANEMRQYDQFGRDFEGSTALTFSAGGPELMGANRFLGYVRSRVDYDGRAFYLLDRASADADFFVTEVDPPDFPERVGTVLDAAEAGAGSGTAPRGSAFTLNVEVDTRGRADEPISDVLAYLVNDPQNPIVRIPVDLSVRAVDAEGSAAREPFILDGAAPNPTRGRSAVRFRLGAPAEVTAEVYNVLGQRVAVLARDEPLAAGPHSLALDTSGLAAGTYLVRVRAGEHAGTGTLTVVR